MSNKAIIKRDYSEIESTQEDFDPGDETQDSASMMEEQMESSTHPGGQLYLCKVPGTDWDGAGLEIAAEAESGDLSTQTVMRSIPLSTLIFLNLFISHFRSK